MRCQRLQTEGMYRLSQIECHDIVSLLQAVNGKEKNHKAVYEPLLDLDRQSVGMLQQKHVVSLS